MADAKAPQHATGDGSSMLSIEPIPLALIEAPLHYILAEHIRQRYVGTALKRFAQAGHVSRAEADMVTAFLDRDLPLHHEDEDADLFPALRRRALPEDNIGAIPARLTDDHRQSESMVADITAALAASPAKSDVALDLGARRVMQAYAASEHRHLAMENGIVMVLARIRLKATDLKTMSARMRRRRGVET